MRRISEELTPEAKARLGEEALRAVWRSLNERLGGFRGIRQVRSQLKDTDVLVVVLCDFSKAAVQMKALFNRQQQVDRLQFALADETPSSGQAMPPISTRQWAVREPGSAAATGKL